MAAKYTAELLATKNKVELRELCRENHIGYNGLNNDGMRAELLKLDDAVPAEVPATEPVATEEPKREPRVLPTLNTEAAPTPAPKPAKERKIQANRPEQNGVKRPSDGTICAQIWAWCDAVHATGAPVKAVELRNALKLDNTTMTVQFYRWRKFMGIQGRQA